MFAKRRTHDLSKAPHRPTGALAAAPSPMALVPSATPDLRRAVPVTVRTEAAKEVILTGEFTNWARAGVRMAPLADGLWRAQLELTPGEYQYRLIVDGEWRDDPAAPKHVPNPFGSENCVLIVG
ncbi:MAG: isoamylase early set domain-containing protein [Planctomycetes bacterium]|nr:isoamylase early set domain-containing protein [Planctomycetota bacterium]